MVSPFATAAEHIVSSYNFVMDSTDIPLELRDALLPIWIYSHQSGNPKLDAPALGILGEFTWTWQPFEDWLGRFREAGRWPYMWADAGIPDLVKHDSQWKLRQARVKLLAHTLTMSAFRCRDGSKRAAFFLKSGWTVSSAGCPVEDEAARMMRDTVQLDDWRTWPPFFPGDRCSIVAAPRDRATSI